VRVLLSASYAGLCFTHTKSKRAYFLRDARYGNDCTFELPGARLSTNGTQPVGAAEFGFEFRIVFEGKPRAYTIDGGFIILGRQGFPVADGYYGMIPNCPAR
jgi:hypothetical protein